MRSTGEHYKPTPFRLELPHRARRSSPEPPLSPVWSKDEAFSDEASAAESDDVSETVSGTALLEAAVPSTAAPSPRPVAELCANGPIVANVVHVFLWGAPGESYGTEADAMQWRAMGLPLGGDLVYPLSCSVNPQDL